MPSKKSLAVELSRLKGFDNPKLNLEQYETESELASSILWHALLRNDIEDKIVCDLGAGTGIIGIGALLLGAKKVYFVEKDIDAIKLLKENLEEYEEEFYEIINSDVSECKLIFDTVVMNPPFGAQIKSADRPFLDFSFKNSKTTYSILPIISEKFYYSYAKEHDKKMHVFEKTGFRIKKHFSHQKKPMVKVEVMIVGFYDNKKSIT